MMLDSLCVCLDDIRFLLLPCPSLPPLPSLPSPPPFLLLLPFLFSQRAGLMETGMLETVKLHATLINSKYGSGPRRSFNAAPVLAHCRDFDFGPCPADTLHLSKMNTDQRTGYYTQELTVKLN